MALGLGTPPAFMGYVGFVKFGTSLVRATSCDIKLSQEITKPDVVDSRFDKTVYQLGPQIVEGAVEFPAIYDSGVVGDSTQDIAETLYRRAVKRNVDGKLDLININVKYTSANASFSYPNCLVNNWRFSVTQQDVVTIGVNVIGINRVASSFVEPTSVPNTRIVTWADAICNIQNTDGSIDITGSYVRNFNIEIANDAERFYALNGQLFPQDIAPRKREVTGSLVFMGRMPGLANWSETNQDRCTEISTLEFGYSINNPNCGGGFDVILPNVVFQIEELSLGNDIFETNVNYHCFPAGSLLNGDPLLDAIQ